MLIQITGGVPIENGAKQLALDDIRSGQSHR